MPAGFRDFTNDINAKSSNVTKMPTYDNFKQNFNSNTKSPMRSSTKKVNDIGAPNEMASNLEVQKAYR